MTSGALMVKVNGSWKPATIMGPPGSTGAQGDPGPQGIQGPTGVSTIIVGSFGQTKTPADLPPDGNFPADWDAPGIPAHQMVIGESVIYLPTNVSDPIYGHLHQFMAPGWVDVGQISGPQGIEGPVGPIGPQGPVGPPLPLGGATAQALTKNSGADQDVAWTGPYLPVAGGNVGGSLFINGGGVSSIVGASFKVNDTYGSGANPETIAPIISSVAAGGSTRVELSAVVPNVNPNTAVGLFRICQGAGNYGFAEVMRGVQGSPVGVNVVGTLSAGDLIDRSRTATKEGIAPLDMQAAAKLIDAVKPVTYRRIIPDNEGQIDPTPPYPRVGLTVEDIENSDCGLDGLVRDDGYSIPGLLAVAISEIKSLRARVAELEAK